MAASKCGMQPRTGMKLWDDVVIKIEAECIAGTVAPSATFCQLWYLYRMLYHMHITLTPIAECVATAVAVQVVWPLQLDTSQEVASCLERCSLLQQMYTSSAASQPQAFLSKRVL